MLKNTTPEENQLILQKRIGQQIANLRRDKGWTQAELAEKIGFSRSKVCRAENGEYDLRFTWICRVLEIFDISHNAFFNFENADYLMHNTLVSEYEF